MARARSFKKLVQRRTRIFKLPRCDIRRRHLTPNLVLRVRGTAHHYVFEVLNSVTVALLLSRDPPQLETGVDLVRVNL